MGADDRLAHGRVGPDCSAPEHDSTLDLGTVTHRYVGSEHDIGSDGRALPDPAPGLDQHGIDGLSRLPGRDGGGLSTGPSVQQVRGGPEVALGRPYIEPVATGGMAEKPLTHQAGKDVALDRACRSGG